MARPAAPRPREIEAFLTRAKAEPAYSYLLIGPETWLRERTAKALTDSMLPDAFVEYNRNVFSGPDIPLDEVVKTANTYPAFAPRRVVVLRQLDMEAAAQHDGFWTTLEAPADTCILIASASPPSRERAKSRTPTRSHSKLAKLFQQRLDFPTLGIAEARAWIDVLARERSTALSNDARELVLELVGTDLGMVEQELEKASLHAYGQPRIERSDVEAVIARTRSHTVWELTDAMVQSDASRAFRELGILLDDGAEPLALIGMIAFKARQLLEGSLMVREGVRQSELGARLRVWGSEVQPFYRAASKSEPRRLSRVLEALREADDKIKSAAVDARTLLEQAVLASVTGGRR